MNPTLHQVMNDYLGTVKLSRSENTFRTYSNGMDYFRGILEDNQIDPQKCEVDALSEDSIGWMIKALKNHAASTERLYLTAVTGFFEYLAGENLAQINLPRVRLLIKQRARIPGQRLPQFPKNSIDLILDHFTTLDIHAAASEDANEEMRLLRDRAFLITLADTGLRVHEACNLRRGDIDWNEGRAIIIGKGNREAVVRFSVRAQAAIDDYIKLRAPLDGTSGRPLGSLPIFARHDKGAGKKIKSITPTTGRNIVTEWVEAILGKAAVGTITPHSFRHYFVTRVLQGTGNLKMAQELARHRNIAVTQRYAHLSDDELDKGYYEVFEQDK